MRRWVSLLLVLAMPIADSALAQDCGGGSGDGVCCGDLDGDGITTSADLAIAEADFGCAGCCNGDVNFDGVVDCNDLNIIDLELVEDGGQPCVGFRPVPLQVWDPNCYDAPCNAACLVARGCLPMEGGASGTVGLVDVNGDGLTDAVSWATVSSARRRRVWRNNGVDPNGLLTWTELCLDPNLTHSTGYGHHLGDYNGDGYPDIATANPFAFLVHHGDPNSTVACFVSVHECLELPLFPTTTETLVWGDLNGDGQVGLFVPAYDTAPYGPGDPNGNHVLENAGSIDPNCPSGGPDILAMSGILAGTQSYGPDPNTDYRRPEGCIVVDYDNDGDGDLFFSCRVWQNNTVSGGTTTFTRLDPNDTGLAVVGEPNAPEEGLVLVDLNMDGHLDVVRVTWGGSGRRSISRGDGTFVHLGTPYLQGYGYGCSVSDWDNDGDPDLTIGGNFHRNMLIESFNGYSGTSPFVRVWCLTDASYDPVQYACPSWGDFDLDGDLDCARGAWGGGVQYIRFERNYLYHNPACADCEPLKRFVRVRPVREAPANGPGGWRDYSENEFGAKAEIVIRNDPNPNTSRLRRVQYTSSAAGYLNQNEYALHYGLPPDPEPNDPESDLRFDVYVDFLARGDEPNDGAGVWRVDWTVNSQLAGIDLASLYVDCKDPDPETLARAITVYREGRVRFKGADPNQAPADPNLARLHTLGGQLTLPGQGAPPPGLTTANVFAGVRFNKEPNSPELRIREIVVDGQLDQTTPGCAYNVVILDVTDPNNIQTVSGMKAYTFPDNHRTFIHVPPPADPNSPDFILPANDGSTTTKYEVRVRVTKYRLNALPSPSGLTNTLGVTVDKGLNTINVLTATGSLCTQIMTLRGDTHTPVTVRLSPTGN